MSVETPGPGRKLAGVQCLRAAAALLVVAYHVHLLEQKLPGRPLMPPQFIYGMSGVDLFFVISGFIIATISAGQFGQPSSARRFLWNRLVRIYPTYWVYFVLVMMLFLAAPGLVNHEHGPPSLLLSFLLLPQRETPLIFVSWTLTYELFFYLVFAVLLLWCRRGQLPYILTAWATVVVAGNLIFDVGQPVLAVIFSPMILEFLLGCAVALFLPQLGHRTALICTCAGVATFVVGSALLDAFRLPFSWWQRTIVYGPASALLVAGIVGLERANVRMPIWLVRLGDASYSLYLSHLMVLSTVVLAWRKTFASAAPTNHIAVALLAVAAAIAWATISYRWIERPTLVALRDPHPSRFLRWRGAIPGPEVR